ncbi:MAG TPA: hypothetical protein VMT81_01420 [Candidatus Paceibacterota bacterium]|nr:hypothetical protein [Candidatus Paceibacterota bacterium]
MSSRNIALIVLAVAVVAVAAGLFIFASRHPAGIGGTSGVTGYRGNSSGTAAAPGGQADNPAVPAQYQSLYNGFEGDITSDMNQIDASWDGSSYPVNYGTVLISANDNSGNTNINAVDQELAGDQLLGVKAVMVSVGFPLFDSNYYTFSGRPTGAEQQYVDFYTAVAQAVHGRGMKLIVEANPMLTGGAISSGKGGNVGPYYKSLTYAEYVSRRSADNVAIAQDMKPDYFILQSEPSTDSSQAQNPAIASEINNPADDAQMVSQFVTDLENANIPGLHRSIKLGAGMGTWQSNWQQYLADFDNIGGLDSIDCHIYSLAPDLNEVGVAMQIADAAHAAGKGASMAEFWLNKFITDRVPTNDLRAVNNFSFWAPLDGQFTLMMMDLANYEKMDYISSFAGLGGLTWAYMDYQSAPCALTAGDVACGDEIISAEMRLANEALANHQLSPYGAAYKGYIANLPAK